MPAQGAASVVGAWQLGEQSLARSVRLTGVASRHPQLELISPSASPAEAAAIMGALERFMRETAPRLEPAATTAEPWARAAILEAVGHEDDAPSAWGDPLPWR
jgi:hypothetical protein